MILLTIFLVLQTIDRLRDRLVKIITDYRTETSLRHGCNDILKADCVNLLVKYYKEARHAVYLSNEEEEARAKKSDNKAYREPEKSSSLRTTGVKSKTKGAARCCICFDPFSIRDVSVVVFFCCHSYHMSCLTDSTYTFSGKKGTKEASSDPTSHYGYEYEYDDGDEEDEDDDQKGTNHMRCILCTTAAS
ncbi:hypothetical protein BT93_H3046 [Corymbia citriodora subsp. variegata]|nr:hypothetical protein BT93_H3046 [Corymbia citriodora subsp. variegata]